MCGIWGFVGSSTGYDVSKLFKSFEIVKNRGPDRSEFKIINEFITLFLGFHRLAIQDKSTRGDQPFSIDVKNDNVNKSIYVMCNGEIYNHRQLTEQYDVKQFLRSKSDCEFLPYIYNIIGFEKMIKNLRGEFAICVIDIDHNNETIDVYLGRDQTAVRPLFIGFDKDQNFAFSSTMSGLIDIVNPLSIRQLHRAEMFHLKYDKTGVTQSSKIYHELDKQLNLNFLSKTNELTIKSKNDDVPYQVIDIINKVLTDAVIVRLESDRPLGALLSGGLDSSLVVSIASEHLKQQGKKLRTFSIGMNGSTDKEYAEMVSRHCDTEHQHIEFSESDFLEAIPDVIKATETHDITTVRASVGQYLISKWISENTDVKVLLIGDGSDELCSGYMYFHNAPNSKDSHHENIKLLENIQYFDSLRADRCIAYNGLEARVPFLDHKFVDLWLSIPRDYRTPNMDAESVIYSKKPIEKWLLRRAFVNDYLPNEVLWRKKEAFSDGVSSNKRSWHQIIQDDVKQLYCKEDFNDEQVRYHLVPPTYEALHYRLIFNRLFGYDTAHVIPFYWMPKWSGNVNDPSARVLKVYEQ